MRMVSRRQQQRFNGEQQGDFEPLLSSSSEQLSQEGSRNHCHGRSSCQKNDRVEDTIKLAVLRLDGTSFNVYVPSKATVGEMKAVLERTVNELEIQTLGYCDIQWEQVWSNFCLCYMNHKLLDDSVSLRGLGIYDDDQVEFVRHAGNQGREKRKKKMLNRFVFA